MNKKNIPIVFIQTIAEACIIFVALMASILLDANGELTGIQLLVMLILLIFGVSFRLLAEGKLIK